MFFENKDKLVTCNFSSSKSYDYIIIRSHTSLRMSNKSQKHKDFERQIGDLEDELKQLQKEHAEDFASGYTEGNGKQSQKKEAGLLSEASRQNINNQIQKLIIICLPEDGTPIPFIYLCLEVTKKFIRSCLANSILLISAEQ